MNARWLCGALGVILLIGVIAVTGISVRSVRPRRALVVFRGDRPARCRGPGPRLVIPAWERAEEIRTGPQRWDGDFTCYSAELILVAVRVEVEYEVADAALVARQMTVLDGSLSDIVGETIDGQLASRPLAWTIGHPDETARAVAESVAGRVVGLGIAARSVRVHRPRVSAADLRELRAPARNGHRTTNGRAAATTNGHATVGTNGNAPAVTHGRGEGATNGRKPTNGLGSPWPRPGAAVN